MTDTMLPILRHLHDAEGDREFAGLLNAVPDSILITYQGDIRFMCRRRSFGPGETLIDLRLSAMRAVRGSDGQIAPELGAGLRRFQYAIGRFARRDAP